MASYLQIENISKSYGPKVLFENIGFNINEGDKIALIAPNGTGKTSLLKILAGKDKSDSGGKITFLKDIRISFLEQEYDFNPQNSIFTQVLESSADLIAHYDHEALLQFEQRVKQLLTSLGLRDYDKKMQFLSGGEIKRVAIVNMLASQADFYIMDEPTNHLDIDAIEFLESYFNKSRCTLLMVTHDRYFLDRVCNAIIEIDKGKVYYYRGNYEEYLEKREERIDNYNAETEKVRNIFRRELEWMRSTPCARTGKAKYRKDAFYELKDRAEQAYTTNSVSMKSLDGSVRLGSKVINCKHLSFYYGERCLLDDFNYNFQRFERVGIVGKNGVGKSTFINILTDNLNSNGRLEGIIDRGESLKIGYYHQSGMQFEEDQTVLETVNDTYLLGQFLFPHDMLNNKISKLSGGERRRLYLLTILMQKPNLLILDEPTNDLDIITLNILEEYLKDYKGSLIIISHDRHFLDRLVDHLFVFYGDGKVKDFIGNYTQYRSFIKDIEAEKKRQERQSDEKKVVEKQRVEQEKKKLSFKEKRELEQLNIDIENLNNEKDEISKLLNQGNLPFEQLETMSKRFEAISNELDEKEFRWLDLMERA